MEKCSSENRLADYLATRLHFSEFHTSNNNIESYDCTIRVGTFSSAYRDFKCHKSILSKASPFFERTFFGNFKEAKMGPDEPILLDNIEPSVFECALRHMYGHVNDLQYKSVLFKVKVYKIADEMLIKTLVQELESCLIGTTAPEIFSLFDLYLFLGNQPGINRCKQILAKVTIEDFRSINWLEICAQSVEEFLTLDCADLEETDLVRGLVSWGKYHVLKEGGDPKNRHLLRTKILPALKRIRFAAMDQDEFTQVCQEEVGAVLGRREKRSILLSITGKKKLAASRHKRKKPPIVFNLPCMQHFNKNKRRDRFSANLIFHVDESAEFIGLRVNTSIAAYGPFKFELYNALNYTVIGSGSSEAKKIAYFGEEYCLIYPKCSLTEGNKYNLSFTFPDAFKDVVRPNFPYFTFPLNSFTVNGLTLTIDSTLVHVFVKSMLFVKSP